MTGPHTSFDWRSLYASDVFNWHQRVIDGRPTCYRRLGVVENLFDLDGIDFEGRADVYIRPLMEVRTDLTDDELKHRIVLIWAYMRHLYPLLSCKSLYAEEFLPQVKGRCWTDKCFVYQRPSNRDEAIASAYRHTTFALDAYPDMDLDDFWSHLRNTGRNLDATDALARLYILPFRRTASGDLMIGNVVTAGHEVADGITMLRLGRSFLDLLNRKESDLLAAIDSICASKVDTIDRLPAAQETLYPVYATNKAHDRWNWAITRILRHVRRPPPASFQNPLRRNRPLQTAVVMPEKYPKVLDYAKVPPLNSGVIESDITGRSRANLIKLCRQAGISIGSGAFTLAGLVMMRFEEAREPGIPYWKRLPFVGSFPVNPRPFLSGKPTTGKEDSLMLAFSDGVTLPFVPSDMDLLKTFRVLGRLAHRQLRQYQKRKRTPAEEVFLGSRSPRELLPTLFLSTMERLDWKARPEQRVGVNTQGAYPAKQSATLATCGISSVGDATGLIGPELYNLDNKTNDVVASFRDWKNGVRPRDGEFLIGSIGAKDSMQFRASYDSCAIDPDKAETWKKVMQSILDFDIEEDVPVLRSLGSVLERTTKL